MNKITIKINGHLYEAYAEDLCELADKFIKNIHYFCEINLADDKLSIEWPDLECYTVMQMPDKTLNIKPGRFILF